MWGLCLAFLSWIGFSPLPFIAKLIGTNEPSLNVLLSLLMSYPIAIWYHTKIRKEYPELKNLYFIVTGVDMAIFNFGFTMYHNAIPALVLYLSTLLLGPQNYKINVIITFVFNMAYLVAGYVMTESEDYDITWTMPQCVLTLKLIALSYDLWDGEKIRINKGTVTKREVNAVTEAPSLIEIFGFVYFPASFLVGPIFSFKRYKSFINDTYPLDTEANVYQRLSILKLVQGLSYLIAFQVGVSVFSMKHMQSEKFLESNIIYRHIYCGLWAHFALYKYISCWLITEACCIRFGISYTVKETSDGTKFDWDGCNNIKIDKFERATKFQHYIDSFNCCTNGFVAEYIYKRLKFLNNKNVSQFLTLLFLALWHGTQSGYYVTFLNEFLIMHMEKELEYILNKTEILHKAWADPILKCVLYIILKSYTIIFMGWSLVPFDLKTASKWWQVYCSLWFSGFVLFVPWSFLYKYILLIMLKKFNLLSNS